MRELEGRSYSEISELLGLTTSALETLLFRARRSLAEELENVVTCQSAELAMSQRLDGRLSRKERRRLDEHLAECAACARLAQTQARQRRAFKGLALLPLPIGLALFKGAPTAAAAASLPTIGGLERRRRHDGCRHGDRGRRRDGRRWRRHRRRTGRRRLAVRRSRREGRRGDRRRRDRHGDGVRGREADRRQAGVGQTRREVGERREGRVRARRDRAGYRTQSRHGATGNARGARPRPPRLTAGRRTATQGSGHRPARRADAGTPSRRTTLGTRRPARARDRRARTGQPGRTSPARHPPTVPDGTGLTARLATAAQVRPRPAGDRAPGDHRHDGDALTTRPRRARDRGRARQEAEEAEEAEEGSHAGRPAAKTRRRRPRTPVGPGSADEHVPRGRRSRDPKHAPKAARRTGLRRVRRRRIGAAPSRQRGFGTAPSCQAPAPAADAPATPSPDTASPPAAGRRQLGKAARVRQAQEVARPPVPRTMRVHEAPIEGVDILPARAIGCGMLRRGTFVLLVALVLGASGVARLRRARRPPRRRAHR